MTAGAASRPARVLLGQLHALGDCIYATTVARQIKSDDPGCHLTWAVGRPARPIVEANPFVDEIWEIDLAGHEDVSAAWYAFKAEALRRQGRGEFDRVHFTQIHPDNYQNFDGTVRASIFRGYPHPITVPVQPVVRLGRAAVERVADFVARHRLHDYRNVILFEFSSRSGQSFVTPEIALEVAARITAARADTCVVLSSDARVPASARIVDASALSFLDNAELVKSCNLLIGCSSGISWLCTSDWAVMPPTIQLLRRDSSVYASMVHDHEYFGLDHSHIIEMTECSAERVERCARAIFEQGVARARAAYHENIRPSFKRYGRTLRRLVRHRQWRMAVGSARVTLRRYGPRPGLLLALCRAPLSVL